MSHVDQSFAGWLYRPYLDLGPAAHGAPFHVFGLDLSARALIEDKSYPRIQAALNASFREVLTTATGLSEHDVASPEDLPRSLRTPRWQQMCDTIADFAALPPQTKVRLLWLLGKLGFYRFTLDIVSEEAANWIRASDSFASIAYLHALARYRLSLENEKQPYDLEEFERVALEAPLGVTSIDAHYQMVVQNVKHLGNVERAESWQSRHLNVIERTRADLDDSTYYLVMSRYHRVGGFLPQMRRDRAGVVREMDLAEHFARALPRRNEIERVTADEMLYPAIESRIKEAVWIGDLNLAAERARLLTALGPYDPRPWLHYGEVLLTLGEIENALKAYRTAARFAPPGREVACFMAGQCYEELGDLESACDSYMAALQTDPLGISAAERLEEVAERLCNEPVLRWARSLLADLRERQTQPARRDAFKDMPPPFDSTVRRESAHT